MKYFSQNSKTRYVYTRGQDSKGALRIVVRMSIRVRYRVRSGPIRDHIRDVRAAVREHAKTVRLKTDYLYFGTDTHIGELSNLALCENPFECRGFMWNTSEHAFQALTRVDQKHRFRFACGGDLASFDTGLRVVFGDDNCEKKKVMHSARKSGRPSMVGIIAKHAVQPTVAHKLGLTLLPKNARSIDSVIEVCIEILLAKYRANPALRDKLMSTRGKTLVEFDRRVAANAKGAQALWTGIVKNGTLHGRNLQGALHMKVRSILEM